MTKETKLTLKQWKSHLKIQQLNFERCDKEVAFAKDKIDYYKAIIKNELVEKGLYKQAIVRAKEVIKKYSK